MRIGLVGCTKSKLGRQAAARDLYSPSARFRGRRRYVERTCEDWLILSAKHHVLAPDELVDPYDVTLVGAPTQVKRSWARAVLIELEDRLEHVSGHHFEIHAGRDYWAFGLVEGLEKRGAKISIPAKGLGMFKLSTFYASRDPEQNPAPRDPGRKKSGLYEPLRTHLRRAKGEEVSLSFGDVERVLGRSLPASAHNHRAWWANHAGTHSHARSWLEVGWKVSEVNLTAKRVVFRKAS